MALQLQGASHLGCVVLKQTIPMSAFLAAKGTPCCKTAGTTFAQTHNHSWCCCWY